LVTFGGLVRKSSFGSLKFLGLVVAPLSICASILEFSSSSLTISTPLFLIVLLAVLVSLGSVVLGFGDTFLGVAIGFSTFGSLGSFLIVAFGVVALGCGFGVVGSWNLSRF